MKSNTYVFIAGPYTAKGGGHDAAHWYEIDAHINEARLWATRLAEQGIPFFCPHMNSAHMEVLAPNKGKEYWYDLDMQILKHATALLLIPGWEESPGVQAEVQRARELGIPIYAHNATQNEVNYFALVQNWHADSERTTNNE